MSDTETAQETNMTNCTCPHPIAEHNEDGCMHPAEGDALAFCPCALKGGHVAPVKLATFWLSTHTALRSIQAVSLVAAKRVASQAARAGAGYVDVHRDSSGVPAALPVARFRAGRWAVAQ